MAGLSQTHPHPALVDRICDWFTQLDRAALKAFRGDRARLVGLVAEAHDLTRAEAAEQLDWVTAPRREKTARAA